MNKNHSNGFYLPMVAGLFFFMKKRPVELVEAPIIEAREVIPGVTGVSKYLEKSHQLFLASQVIEDDNQLLPRLGLVTGVEKYLKDQQRAPISGVTKYLYKLAIADKQRQALFPEVKVTGVSDYLKKQEKLHKLTGVTRYLNKQTNAPKPTGVARYVVKQSILDKQAKVLHPSSSVALSSVAKYLAKQQESEKLSTVGRYLAKQALVNKLEKNNQVKPVFTGVSKYLDLIKDEPKLSRVSKYVARQALEAKHSSVVETSVDRYMRSRG